ncbi:DUF6545 domain-containing protein [Streptomyces sp. NPDC091268]|uniref:DUF6545 domain-containing protein n=1 Tax=Streptomyces sp. NPDC091268 TaxID=3365979 RepID=UPI003812392B
MQGGPNYYVPAAILAVALVAKLPALVRGWRSPMVRSVNLLLFLPCVGFVLSSAPTISFVNRLSGISNLSALLVYGLLTAYACACLVLTEHWRGDTRADAGAGTRRRVRGWILGCCLVIAALVVLFSLGEAPVERTVDFDTYYATTPFIREMLVLYLVAYLVAACATAAVCWDWTVDLTRKTAGRERTTVDASMRVGLLVLVVASVANIIFGSFKLMAIAARWAGHDWDALNESVGPFIALSGMMVGCGFLVPVFGPWLIERVWQPLLTVIALRPLWRMVRRRSTASPQRVLLGTPWYSGPEHLLVHRVTAIHDWMLEMVAYCTDEVRRLAHADAREAGLAEPEAVAVGLAAMFKAAAYDRARNAPADEEQSGLAAAALRSAEARYRGLLVSISRALPKAPAPHPPGPTGPGGWGRRATCWWWR